MSPLRKVFYFEYSVLSSLIPQHPLLFLFQVAWSSKESACGTMLNHFLKYRNKKIEQEAHAMYSLGKNSLPLSSRAVSRPQVPSPSPSLSNACHADYGCEGDYDKIDGKFRSPPPPSPNQWWESGAFWLFWELHSWLRKKGGLIFYCIYYFQDCNCSKVELAFLCAARRGWGKFLSFLLGGARNGKNLKRGSAGNKSKHLATPK